MNLPSIQLEKEVNPVSIPVVRINKTLAAILFVLLSAISLQAAAVNATVYSVSGSSEFAGPGSSSYAPLTKGQVLATGSTVRTGDDGMAVLVATPGSAVQLGNNSILKINELAFAKSGGVVTERKASLQLTSGVVSALIDPSTP